MLRCRRQLPQAVAADLSYRAQELLLSTAAFAGAKSLALYSPIQNEISTNWIFAAAVAQGKTVFYPRVRGAVLELVPVRTQAELQQGSFGVMEPAPTLAATAAVPELILVPGVAFDRRGHRLGYGRGYYDRYLGRSPSSMLKFGFCYAFQLCDRLPDDDHDQRLDALVTESEVISCHHKVADLT